MSPDGAERPIAIRKRPDLIARAHRIGARRIWRVKDPVALEYFEFSDQEFAILDMLDGSTTLAGIQRRFEQMFSPLRLGLGQLQSYLHRLHESSLVLATAPGAGARLLERRRDRTSRELTYRLFSILALRFRGIDPQRLLDWLQARLWWIFSAWFLTGCGILVAGAAIVAGVHFETIQSRISSLGDFLTPGNVVWLALALAGAKVLHELAHGLTCRHFRGECHELGLMLLVFTPCLYCNVSDAWMLPGRRERILISAAGMIAEVILAGLCTFLWWFSQPGLFNSICLDVMVVCSVSTVAFNANPLLRYDGYFILADCLQESNLAQKSGALVRQAAREWFCGIPMSEQSWRTVDYPLRLALYGVLSAAYRWLVSAMILWFAFTFFKAQGLPSLGWVVVCLGLAGILISPISLLAGFLNDPAQRRQLDRGRLNRSAAVLGALLVAAVFIPLPRRITAEVVLGAPAAARVYVPVAGQLQQSLPAGKRVRRGDVLAQLTNPQLQRDIEKTAGERNQAQRHLDHLEVSRVDDPAASAQIPAAREALAGLERRLAQQRHDEQRLALRAPVDGVVMPAPHRSQRSVRRPELPLWQGTPLDEINTGCWLVTGTLFCQVGDPADVGPMLMINQADVDFVRPGQPVRLRVDEWPAAILTGTITEVAAINLEVLPREAESQRQVAARPDSAGLMRPVETTYMARVALSEHRQQLLLRGRGVAKISTAPAPLAQRLYRALRQTFHFQM